MSCLQNHCNLIHWLCKYTENLSLHPRRTESNQQLHDHLTLQRNVISNNGRLNKFVRRLYEMLTAERDNGIVEWRRGLLVLHNINNFANQVLPKYFNTRNFSKCIWYVSFLLLYSYFRDIDLILIAQPWYVQKHFADNWTIMVRNYSNIYYYSNRGTQMLIFHLTFIYIYITQGFFMWDLSLHLDQQPPRPCGYIKTLQIMVQTPSLAYLS